VPLSEKIMDLIKYVLPQGIIIFLVIGVIFLGVATPSEAAATGSIGTIMLAFVYKRMTWPVFKKSIIGTLSVSGMIFLIIAGATAFSQILAFSGATNGLSDIVMNLSLPPIVIIIIMMVIVLFLGSFMDVVAIMMITLPIFIPVVKSVGYSTVWFCVLFLLNLEMAMTTPPFGMSLFVMKGVAPEDTKMMDIYKAGLPFLGLDLLVMVLILVFPSLALWLPKLMS
jgi:tripartite ATP-independent transporter DctM subunit